MKHSLVCLCLMMALMVSTQAQPSCHVYKAFRTTANSSTLLDTILVVDDFPVASVQVSRVSLFHPNAQNLQLSLAHISAAGPVADSASGPAELSPVALKAAEGGSPDAAVGTVYMPESSMGGTSAGQWVLRISDTTTGTGRQPITLSGWTLQLCSSTPVTAAQGPTATGAAAGEGVVFVQYPAGRPAAQSQSSADVIQYQTAPMAGAESAETGTVAADVTQSQAVADMTQSPAAADVTLAQPAAARGPCTASDHRSGLAVSRCRRRPQSQPEATGTGTSSGAPSGARGPGPKPGPPLPREPQERPAMPRVSVSVSDRGVSFNLTRLNSTTAVTAGSNETQPAISVAFGRR